MPSSQPRNAILTKSPCPSSDCDGRLPDEKGVLPVRDNPYRAQRGARGAAWKQMSSWRPRTVEPDLPHCATGLCCCPNRSNTQSKAVRVPTSTSDLRCRCVMSGPSLFICHRRLPVRWIGAVAICSVSVAALVTSLVSVLGDLLSVHFGGNTAAAEPESGFHGTHSGDYLYRIGASCSPDGSQDRFPPSV